MILFLEGEYASAVVRVVAGMWKEYDHIESVGGKDTVFIRIGQIIRDKISSSRIVEL